MEQQFEEQYWADAQLSVKQLFFNFLLVTINNYIRFYKVPEDTVADGTAANAFLTSDDYFDFERYLRWQEERSIKNKDTNIEFIRQLVDTQGFHKFIEQNCIGGKEN